MVTPHTLNNDLDFDQPKKMITAGFFIDIF